MDSPENDIRLSQYVKNRVAFLEAWPPLDLSSLGLPLTASASFSRIPRQQYLCFVRSQVASKKFSFFHSPFTFLYNTLNHNLFNKVKGIFVLSLFSAFFVMPSWESFIAWNYQGRYPGLSTHWPYVPTFSGQQYKTTCFTSEEDAVSPERTWHSTVKQVVLPLQERWKEVKGQIGLSPGSCAWQSNG